MRTLNLSLPLLCMLCAGLPADAQEANHAACSADTLIISTIKPLSADLKSDLSKYPEWLPY